MNPRASLIRLLCCLPLLTVSTGCSWDSVKQTSYEGLESIRRQQCLDNPDGECPAERTRYQDYQDERERLQAEQG